jgi:agmatinase
MPTKLSLLTFLDKPSDIFHDFILFSAPLDITVSNRRGTRFGPNAIRRESSFLDTFSSRTGLDLDSLDLGDIGDVDCISIEECLNGIEQTLKRINGFPIILGGEHTISLGAIRTLKPELVVVFDAHLDLRDELFGQRICHATYLRRAIEETQCKALVVGARALSREEIAFAESSKNVAYIAARDCINDPKGTIERINRDVRSVDSVYLSIDLDVLDPAYAPAVGNPHPEGLSTTLLLDSIDTVMNGKLVGMDLNEVYPHYDFGVTATTAAYIVMESLYSYLRHNDE